MSTGTIEGYAVGNRSYQLVPKPQEVVLVTEKGRPDVWRVWPNGTPHRMFFATEEDAERCLAGVREALR